MVMRLNEQLWAGSRQEYRSDSHLLCFVLACDRTLSKVSSHQLQLSKTTNTNRTSCNDRNHQRCGSLPIAVRSTPSPFATS